ncbi:MAG TPA: glutathione S-transferase family protein [Caulobacteraceae bacterium]|nr:glutathione S-transferase family protein [Caulobacteraceae bacterium]
MILIGHYDSPFVRRVAIALRLYDMPFEHRAWSVFGDAEKIAAFNPLRRVPTLVLDDGDVLIESAAILEALDEIAGEARALVPRRGAVRRRLLKVCALGAGMADKAVSLVYERVLHERATPMWIERCRSQMSSVLDVLEADRAAGAGPWWLGEALTHADIMIACALRFVSEAHPDVFDLAAWPALKAHSAACEAMAVFQAFQQPFFVSAPAPAPAPAQA